MRVLSFFTLRIAGKGTFAVPAFCPFLYEKEPTKYVYVRMYT